MKTSTEILTRPNLHSARLKFADSVNIIMYYIYTSTLLQQEKLIADPI